MNVILPLTAISIFALSASSLHATQTNWVDHYIAAHGHCMQQPPNLSTAPLEKPIEEWTDGDLTDLKAALDRCDALPEEQTGVSRMWTGNFYESIASIVHAQKVRVAQQVEAQKYASERAAQDKATREHKAEAEKQAEAARLAALERAAEQETLDRKASEERAKSIAEEQKAATRLAEESEARAKAARMEAQARYGVEAAKQRAARAEAAARNADQQAEADRQMADRRFAEAYPGSNASRADAPGGQVTFQLRKRILGCTSKSVFDEALGSLEANDVWRATKITESGQQRGLCGYVQPGTYVIARRTQKSACIVRVGEGDACSWVFNFVNK